MEGAQKIVNTVFCKQPHPITKCLQPGAEIKHNCNIRRGNAIGSQQLLYAVYFWPVFAFSTLNLLEPGREFLKKETVKRHKATASDVAAKAGVSKWTVSRAFTPGASISEKTRNRVLTVAKKLGYRPNLLARSLSQKRTHIIGVVIDELKNPHSMLMRDEVTRQLQARG